MVYLIHIWAKKKPNKLKWNSTSNCIGESTNIGWSKNNELRCDFIHSLFIIQYIWFAVHAHKNWNKIGLPLRSILMNLLPTWANNNGILLFIKTKTKKKNLLLLVYCHSWFDSIRSNGANNKGQNEKCQQPDKQITF